MKFFCPFIALALGVVASDDISSRPRTFQIPTEDSNRIEARGSSNVNDEVRVRLDLEDTNDESFRFEVEYRLATTSSNPDTRFRMRFFNHISFLESGATPGFQPSEDTQKTSSSTNRGSWTMNTVLPTTPVNGVYTWDAKNSNGIGHTLYLTTNQTAVNGVGITANQLKFDVKLNSIVWPEAAATHLAFRCRLETESGDGVKTITNGLQTTAGSFLGQFQWQPFVSTAGGVQLPLVVTTTTESNNTFHYFTIDAKKSIVEAGYPLLWDPVLGISAQNVNSAPSSTIAALPLYCVLTVLAARLL